MSEWKEVRLGDICSSQNGYAFKSSSFNPQGKINVIKIKELKNGFVEFTDDTAKLDIKPELDKFIISKGDVLFALTGDPITRPNPSSWVGRVSLYNFYDPAYLNQRVGKIICGDRIDNLFLYYFFRQFSVFKTLASQAKGSASQANISLKDILDTVVKIPLLNEQQEIASILSSLDDKIAVNRRICENLEAQAQDLFKHWFIDLAPYKNGNFVESELGMIHEGWSVGRAEDFYTINIGKTPPRAERKWFSESRENNIIWISISDMGGCGAFISDSKEYLTPEAQSKFNIVMVPVGTVLLSFKLTLGRVAIADAELTTNEAIARFILPSFDYREYTYLYLKQFKYGRLGSTSSIATAVNSKIIKAMPFLMPPKEVIMDFFFFFLKLYDEIKNLNQESTRLSTLRDTLLPKLMSGQIKV